MEYTGRRSAFRPRPIDIDKPMPIFHEEVDDDSSRIGPEVKTGMEEVEEQELHFQEALKLFNKKNQSIIAIPTPNVEIVKGYDEEETDPFNPPHSSYIKYQEPFHQVEYDMEEDDFDFLDDLLMSGHQLKEDEYEWLIDRFEITNGRSVITKKKKLKFCSH